MVDTFVSAGFTHGLTLQWNRPLAYHRATTDMKALHARVDRALLGARFNKSNERTRAVFVFEGVEHVNLHVHSLWKVPDVVAQKFESLFWGEFSGKPNAWKLVVPAGSCKLLISDNPLAAAWYDTKEMHMRADDKRIVFSHDFISCDSHIAGVSA